VPRPRVPRCPPPRHELPPRARHAVCPSRRLPGAPETLRPLRLPAALDELGVLMEDSSASGNPTLQLVAGYMYSYEQEYEKALRAIHNGYTLEQCV
jgi:hypothetical protein